LELEKSDRLLEHREEINALMIAIKPNIIEHYTKNFNKTLIKEYIKSIRNEELENEIKLGMKMKKDLMME
jgi:hypothetical protein